MPIISCGIIGNLLLLNIVFRNRALHTPTNYILVNMIAADTLTLIVCPVMFICSDFFQNFVLGPLGCKMDGFLQGFFIIKILTLFCSLGNFIVFFYSGLCFRLLFLLGIFQLHSYLNYHVEMLLMLLLLLLLLYYFYFFLVTFLLTAVLNLCVVSYDRLTAIVLPMEKRITMQGAKMTMLFTWMLGLTISIPFAIYRNYKV